jgi:hypothetical protein
MTKRKFAYAPKPRSTVPLRGTTARIELKLDHASDLSLEWARRFIRRGPPAMEVDPLASGIVRRALRVYIEHLQRADLDPAQEAREVRSACSAISPDTERRLAAWNRLEAHQQGQPFPSFRDVLTEPRDAIDWDAFHDRVDALGDELTTHARKRT